jgi:hypothetical protein
VIKEDHKREIRKILVNYMPLFKAMVNDIEKIPEHEHSEVSSKPSFLVNFTFHGLTAIQQILAWRISCFQNCVGTTWHIQLRRKHN